MKHTNLTKFLCLTFLFSYLWQSLIFFTGGVNSILFPFLMLIPGMIALFFLLRTEQKLRNIGWGIRRWWYVFPAIFIPIAVVVTSIVSLELLDAGEWSNKIFIFRNGLVEIPNIPLILGNHTQNYGYFTLNFTLTLFLQSSMGCLFTLGEELGWRGYAQRKIVKLYGLNRGLIILGIIWGYWHLPIILMGYNFPNHPIIGALFLMPLGTIFLGIFLGWMYIRSNSIWMPALAHAAANLLAVLLFSGVIMYQDELYRQCIWIGLWGTIAGLCLLSLNRITIVKIPKIVKPSLVATDV